MNLSIELFLKQLENQLTENITTGGSGYEGVPQCFVWSSIQRAKYIINLWGYDLRFSVDKIKELINPFFWNFDSKYIYMQSVQSIVSKIKSILPEVMQ